MSRKESMEENLEIVEYLNSHTPDEIIVNADTLLADLLENEDFHENGIAEELFSIWKVASDRDAVEKVFELFAGTTFEKYLLKCQQEITNAGADEKDKLYSVEIGMEKSYRITKSLCVTKKQLEQLRNGNNPFYRFLDEEMRNGTGEVEYDYYAEHENGEVIMEWS